MTGYPLVDAGMRQLRARGLDAQPRRLVDRLVPRQGPRDRLAATARAHFFDLLLDGDVAQNVGNWQWVAGTGVDTRPNRIFNPTAQAKRLDPDGAYVRRYVPELRTCRPDLAARVSSRRVPAADRRPRRGCRGPSGQARVSVTA